MAESTTIRVSEGTWQRLNDLKRPGLTFEEIIVALLDESEDELKRQKAAPDGGAPDGG